MDDKQKKLLEFLLADFDALKSEIARRSNLQKAIVAAVLAFYAWSFQRLLSNHIIELTVVLIAWVVSFIAFTFYIREGSEIGRLGWTIKSKIAVPVSKILGVSPEKVIPSEAHSTEPCAGTWRKMVSILFDIVLYLLAPLYLTINHLCRVNGT